MFVLIAALVAVSPAFAGGVEGAFDPCTVTLTADGRGVVSRSGIVAGEQRMPYKMAVELIGANGHSAQRCADAAGTLALQNASAQALVEVAKAKAKLVEAMGKEKCPDNAKGDSFCWRSVGADGSVSHVEASGDAAGTAAWAHGQGATPYEYSAADRAMRDLRNVQLALNPPRVIYETTPRGNAPPESSSPTPDPAEVERARVAAEEARKVAREAEEKKLAEARADADTNGRINGGGK